jgi:hypothetical protein
MWTHDLSPSERRFLAAMNKLGFGRFELLRIERGELILDPWPFSVRNVKFCTADVERVAAPANCDLKKQVAEFFEYVRAVDAGEIRTLEVHNGLPFSMEIEQHAEHI